MQWKDETWNSVFATVNEYLDDAPELKKAKSVSSLYPNSEVDVISELESFIVQPDED